MNSEVSLASALASLKYVSGSPLLKTALNSNSLTGCVKEFKSKLFEAIESGRVSDNFLKNAAECLYDLKACDRDASYRLSRTFETRSGIISSQLQGGVLWAYYKNPGLNRARRKVIAASCRVAIKQATREFLDLRENVTNIAKFGPILRNLRVVGECYTLPVEAKARLEQSILESSEVLKLCLECFPLLLQSCRAFAAMRLDNEKVGAVIVEVLSEYLQREDLVVLSEVGAVLKVLYNWRIRRTEGAVPCIELFRELLEAGKFDFLRNCSATIKLLTSAVRLPRSAVSEALCRLILANSGSVPSFCSNSDLVLFFNALSQYKKAYPQVELPQLGHIVSNLETYVRFSYPGVERKDLVTIQRSGTILKDHVDLKELLEAVSSRLSSS